MILRNRKGQVGIFVALIFQVIFVFFAMLVNVGLVVHHKINLQQSADIAAYYGAMKQAEIMNVMAHVNYQMRQSWKLMAWRYRVLGTFGFEKNLNLPGTQIEFPVVWPGPPGGKKPQYNPPSRPFVCPDAGDFQGLTLSDVPFMCMGHDGWGDWISPAGGTGDETFCKVNCESFKSIPFKIGTIPSVPSTPIFGEGLAKSVEAAIGNANEILDDVCKKMAPITTQQLAIYYGSYIRDTQNRKNFIMMLAKNLGLDGAKMRDIEGNLVFDGVEKTFKNNLTEANLTSYSKIKVFNSVDNNRAVDMLHEITFKKLLFFMMACDPRSPGDTDRSFLPKPVYGDGNDLDPIIDLQFNDLLGGIFPAAVQNTIRGTLAQNSDSYNTIGFEKNPWIQVYYGVKATTEPKIPFLPLAKIKMHAISFAKPFGGTMGPWYFNKWTSSAQKSEGAFATNRVDFNLPMTDLSEEATGPTGLKKAIEYLFNYSTHVGDFFSTDGAPVGSGKNKKGGLANTDLVALYHSMLANKQTNTSGDSTASVTSSKTKEPKATFFRKPDVWPKFEHWFHLATEDLSSPNYDTLAANGRKKDVGKGSNTYERDIELTVVAPNQFDVTYYSIEPDFYNVYANKMSNDVIKIIADATGTAEVPVIPLDHGNWDYKRDGSVDMEGIPRDFSVRHQIQVTKELFKDHIADMKTVNGSNFPTLAVDVISSAQSTLLTGWTYLNLVPKPDEGFVAFPKQNEERFSMEFGECKDPENAAFKSMGEITGDNGLQPPTPGNCITGGRTGYSVKLISSEMVRDRIYKALGGEGADGPIANPVTDDFLRF